ncbi:Peptide chain release factor 1 [Polystyrenella longa]|uniref:Peptide chain release factor 1 n=1 Tax=Polystyrenella longa TaxID=2528007 RepID=A0A518CPY8_9PLAN|nr:peptide chain release factor-like protein [Polystyrenella longa]QDU81296.1 Peptide chain release factor 1 [Polystyrenella longa]
MHPAELSPDQLLKECRVTRTRRSGPGGQHRNKVETAIVLDHLPTGLQAEANEERSQPANQRKALKRLRLKLAVEIRQPERLDQIPSQFWKNRFPTGRLQISAKHEEFPVVLAEALDALQGNDYEVNRAAIQLGCSGSQLTKLLKQEQTAWVEVNRIRSELGYHKLK